MATIDTDVSNYTLSELMAIVEIEDLKPNSIVENTNYWIIKYKTKEFKVSLMMIGKH